MKKMAWQEKVNVVENQAIETIQYEQQKKKILEVK
jgi:hypothetical protein